MSTCPLCRRKARRACPALGQQICPNCCGTKRMVEIACPDDCPYLVSARQHPPSVVVRQRQDDLGQLVRFMRDLNEGQSRLFFLLLTFVSANPSGQTANPTRLDGSLTPDLQPLLDEDVAEAMGALAATYETAARGVLYEHRPTSLPAVRLLDQLAAVLAKAGERGGSPFQRDAAVVLRRVEAAARAPSTAAAPGRRAFLDLVGRFVGAQAESRPVEKPEESPRVILS